MFKLTKILNPSIVEAFNLLSKKDKKKYLLISFIQSFLALLDLFAVALTGVIGALTISGIQSGKPGLRVNKVLDFFSINNLDIYWQIGILSILASFVFVSRTLLTMYFTKKIYIFLSNKGRQMTLTLYSKYFNQNLSGIQKLDPQSTLFSLTSGINSITLLLFGNISNILADFSLVLVITLGLLVVDPLTAVLTISFFSLLAIILIRILGSKSRSLGFKGSQIVIKSNAMILDSINLFRELYVRNQRNSYVKKVDNERSELASITATQLFLPNFGKYIFESSIVLLSLVIAVLQFLLNDARHAVAALAIFIAAGTRISPAVLRLQNSFLQIKGVIGSSKVTFEMINNLRNVPSLEEKTQNFVTTNNYLKPEIELQNVWFRYTDDSNWVIKDVNLKIDSGTSVALIGPSGAGKSTLIDLILGVIEPQKGSIMISKDEPKKIISKYPGAISYVPQKVQILSGSIRENVVLGNYENMEIDELVWNALKIAKLDKVINNFPNKLDTFISDSNPLLSGGEKQRLIIARAFFTLPKLIVLDEATSAMDNLLETEVSNAIKDYSLDTTLIIIAHKLSTIEHVDKVLYLNNGEMLDIGTYENIKTKLPEYVAIANLEIK